MIPHLPNLGAITFELAADRVSAFGAIAYLGQMETLHRLWEKRPAEATLRIPQMQAMPLPVSQAMPHATPDVWEAVIARHMLPESDRPPALHRRQPAPSPRFNEERGIPFLRGCVDFPLKLQHGGVRPQFRRDLLQLLMGLDMVTQAEPTLGGLKVDAIGWLECSHLQDITASFCGSRAGSSSTCLRN